MRDSISPILVLLLIHGALCSRSVTAGEFNGDYSKLSGIIIPGFASTQLRAWSILDCPYSPLDFNPLDLVWLDTTKACFFTHFPFRRRFVFAKCVSSFPYWFFFCDLLFPFSKTVFILYFIMNGYVHVYYSRSFGICTVLITQKIS